MTLTSDLNLVFARANEFTRRNIRMLYKSEAKRPADGERPITRGGGSDQLAIAVDGLIV